jgi:ankyrin repeat protein
MSLLENLARAIERRDLEHVESLFANGSIDVNARVPREGNPPALMYAAELSRIDIIESILKAGARIDECNDSGATACHAAVTYRHVDALKLLLTHGPNLAQLDANGHGLVEYSLRYTEEEKFG